jgi:hypothetical protein
MAVARIALSAFLIGLPTFAVAAGGEGQDEDATRMTIGQLEGELIIVERTLGGSRVH